MEKNNLLCASHGATSCWVRELLGFGPMCCADPVLLKVGLLGLAPAGWGDFILRIAVSLAAPLAPSMVSALWTVLTVGQEAAGNRSTALLALWLQCLLTAEACSSVHPAWNWGKCSRITAVAHRSKPGNAQKHWRMFHCSTEIAAIGVLRWFWRAWNSREKEEGKQKCTSTDTFGSEVC